MTGIDQQAILQTKAAPQGHGKGQQDLTGDGAFLVFFGKGTATEVKTISGAPSIELERQQNPHAVTVQGSPPNSPMRGVAPPGGADVSGGTPSADHETDGHTRDLAASIATTRQDAAMLPLHETAVQNNSDDAATLPKSQWPPADGITLKQFHTHKASSALPLTPVTMDAQKFEPPDSVSLVNTAISAQILAPLQPEKPDAAPTVIDESAPPFVAPLMAQPYPNMVQKNPDTIFAMQGDHALQLPSKLNQAVSAVALYQLPNQPNVAGLLPANPVAGYTSTKQATVIPDTPSGASQTVTQGNSLTASAGAVDTATAVKNPNVSAQQAGPPDRMPKSETSPDTIQEPPAGPPRMVSGSDPAPTATISRYQTAALVQASGSSPQMVSLRQTNSSESPSGPSLASQSYATSNPGQPLPIGAATAPPPDARHAAPFA